MIRQGSCDVSLTYTIALNLIRLLASPLNEAGTASREIFRSVSVTEKETTAHLDIHLAPTKGECRSESGSERPMVENADHAELQVLLLLQVERVNIPRRSVVLPLCYKRVHLPSTV